MYGSHVSTCLISFMYKGTDLQKRRHRAFRSSVMDVEARFKSKKPEDRNLFYLLDLASWVMGFHLFNKGNLSIRIRLLTILCIIFIALFQQAMKFFYTTGIEHKTESICSSIVIVCGFTKLVFLRIDHDELNNIFTTLRRMMYEQISDKTDRLIITKVDRNVKYVVVFFTCLDGFTFFSLNFTSVLHNIKHQDKLKLLLQTWFPIDVFCNTFSFVTAFIWVSFSIFCCTIVISGMRILFCSTNMLIVAQIKIFQEQLRSFENVIKAKVGERECIKNLVEQHKIVIKLANSMNSVFAYSHLFEVIISSIQVCLLTFLCLKIGLKDPKIGFYFPFLFGSTISLFVICFMGQIIIDESIKINDAAFGVSWYELTPSLRKEYLFILRQTNRSLMFHVKQTFTMDMRTFLNSIQSTYSLMAIINSMESSSSK